MAYYFWSRKSAWRDASKTGLISYTFVRDVLYWSYLTTRWQHCAADLLMGSQRLKNVSVQLKHHISSSILNLLSLPPFLPPPLSLVLPCLVLAPVRSSWISVKLLDTACNTTWTASLQASGTILNFPSNFLSHFCNCQFRLFVPGLFCNMFLVVLHTPEPATPPSRVSSLHFFGTGKFKYVTCL